MSSSRVPPVPNSDERVDERLDDAETQGGEDPETCLLAGQCVLELVIIGRTSAQTPG